MTTEDAAAVAIVPEAATVVVPAAVEALALRLRRVAAVLRGVAETARAIRMGPTEASVLLCEITVDEVADALESLSSHHGG